jgi:hypothetical protein
MLIFIKTTMHVIVSLSMWLQVARIFIPYAMRAKKVDMKRLKHAIWDILVSQEGCKVRNHLHARTAKYFFGTAGQ